jgi:hypothetical protein
MGVRTKPLPSVEGRNGVEEHVLEAAKPAKSKVMKLVVPAPAVQRLEVELRGIAPLVIRAWDQKTIQILEGKATGEKTRQRENVDPEAVFNGARYISIEGWDGIPASAFKAAIVDAVGCLDIPRNDFSMTLGKKSFFVQADGVCKLSGRDLVRIVGTEPTMFKLMQPTSGGGPYMSYRPMYKKWGCRLHVQYNATRIDAQGVLNLIANAGYWVGVGEHRPSSKESKTGTFGRFEIVPTKE